MNHNKDVKQYVLRLDRYHYYMMNIVDYLVGNTDRHWGNWGVLVNNENNKPVRLYDLMDFNQAFHACDNPDGGSCQTTFGECVSQREAALEAVRKVGLNQIKEVKKECFRELPEYYEMFCKRLELLKKQ